MRHPFLVVTLIPALVLSLLAPATIAGAGHTAGALVYELDPAQSEVHFSVSDPLHTVHGTFPVKRGTIHFDSETGEAAGEVVVDLNGGSSGSRARDRRMHKDILESERYPEAVFIPQHVEGRLVSEGSTNMEVHGLFKIHGASHEVTLQVRAQSKGDQVTASMNFVMPYVQWGMKNPSTFLLRVSDKVQLDIRAAGRIHPATS